MNLSLRKQSFFGIISSMFSSQKIVCVYRGIDTFKFIFFIDQDKNIRAINEDFVTITKIPSLDETQEIMTTKVKVEIVYNSFDDVTIDKPNLESSYNITVEPEATAMNLFMEIQGKLGSYLEDRPALKNIIESPSMIY